LIRDFVKWDDQPASALSLVESILRAWRIALTEPWGPVYVCIDAGLQEQSIVSEEAARLLTDLERGRPSRPPSMSEEDADLVAGALRAAEFPVFLVDRVGRSEAAFHSLSRLAEDWGIPVVEA